MQHNKPHSLLSGDTGDAVIICEWIRVLVIACEKWAPAPQQLPHESLGHATTFSCNGHARESLFHE